MSTYSDKLRDPRWQKKRLDVMHIAQFKCERCGFDTEELNVHHVKYRKGAEPWEYEDSEFVCLCATCHKQTHELKDALSALASCKDGNAFVGLCRIAERAALDINAMHGLGWVALASSQSDIDCFEGAAKASFGIATSASKERSAVQ